MAWHPFRNFRLKVVALLLGFVLWFTVSGQQADLAITGVPVVYVNTPPGLELTERTNLVDIHVRGLDNQLRAAMPRDFEARVDLSDALAGSQTIMLRTDQVTGPSGLIVTDVDPGVASVILERAGMANLPVRPLVEGVPAPGFVVSQITVEPSTVAVLGPEGRIAGATAAITDRLSIDGARASVTQSLNVGVPDSALRLRESKKATVVVTIEQAGERPFPALRVAVRNVAPGLRATVEPSVVSVVLRGALSLLARLEPSAVVPYVDVSSLGRGRYEALPVLLDPGGTLTIASLRPATVIVTIN